MQNCWILVRQKKKKKSPADFVSTGTKIFLVPVTWRNKKSYVLRLMTERIVNRRVSEAERSCREGA